MKKSIVNLFAVLSTLVLTLNANATTATPPAAKKLSQQERIDRGFKSGQLTKAEYDKLNKEQDALRTMRKSYKEDGITTEERAILDGQTALQNKEIYDERHDWQMNKKKVKKSFRDRINNGSKKGSLNADERQELNKAQAEINDKQKEILADGVVSKDEKDAFVEMVNAQDQAIFDQKHDGEVKVLTTKDMDPGMRP